MSALFSRSSFLPINMITVNNFLFFFFLFFAAILPVIFSTPTPSSSFPTDGLDPYAETAQIRINDRVQTIDTPLRPSPEQILAANASGRAGSTLVPFVGGIIDLPEKTDIYSADLLSGRPGFAFAFWSSAEDGPFVSPSVNWDDSVLEVPEDRFASPSSSSSSSSSSADPAGRSVRFPGAERIIWYIQDDPLNSFVALAQYEDPNSGTSTRSGNNNNNNSSSTIRTEVQTLAFRRTGDLSIDYKILRHKKVAKWRFPRAGWFGRGGGGGSRQRQRQKGSEPSGSNVVGADDGEKDEGRGDADDSSSSSSGGGGEGERGAGAAGAGERKVVKKLAVLEMAPNIDDDGIPKDNGPTCYALPSFLLGSGVEVTPGRPLINPKRRVAELYCTPNINTEWQRGI